MRNRDVAGLRGNPRSTSSASLLLLSLLMACSGLLSSVASAESEGVVSLKRTVAVARFTNETRSGQTFLVDASGDRIGKQASDILSARLAGTGKFLMFERIDLTQVSVEQALAGLQDEGVAVDYLIVGSVSEFGRSTESDTGIFSRARIQRAYAKVNVRLIEVATGRIIHASEGSGEATTETKRTWGVGSSAGFDQSLTDQSISAAISELVSNLVENMTSKPWRSFVLGKDGDLYMIAGGPSQGLTAGMQLFVYEEGRQVTNPQTGAKISLPGTKVGTLRVLHSIGEDEFNELSFAQLTDGALGEDFDELYISNE